MKKATRFAVVMATVFGAACAHAQDSYVGLSSTTSGEVKVRFGNGQISDKHNDPTSWKIYGGLKLNEVFGVEAGYLNSGTFDIANPAAGSTEISHVKARTLYVAGTASMPLTESLSLFGKAGIANHRLSIAYDAGESNRAATRAMLGFGADYKIGKNVSAVLEYNFYGKRDHTRQQKLEAGLRYAF
jgi:OOP family OmpA-OmpF porin